MSATTALRIGVHQLDESVDPLDVYQNGTSEHRVFWSQPDQDLTFAAIGAARVVEAPSGHRFGALAKVRRELFAELDLDGVEPHNIPRLVGGFAFAETTSPHGPPWDGFGIGRLVLPEVLVISDAHGVRAITIGDVDLSSAIDTSPRSASTHQLPAAIDTATCPAYLDLVARSLQAIDDGRFDKVVSARVLSFPAVVDMGLVLDNLRSTFPDCATFAIGYGDDTFVGASPERLLKMGPDGITTAALAGSKPRGADDQSDIDLAMELFQSQKERAEHAYVVDAITSGLTSLGLEVTVPSQPEVLQLRSIQHLYTPIEVVNPGADIDAVEVVGSLHPTPAVAGSNKAAVAWIDEHEGIDRGWYAGPVGWVDLAGNAEFRVALRSGLIAQGQAHLFAGCGIVDGSEPQHELDETVTKLRPMLGALGIGTPGPGPGA